MSDMPQSIINNEFDYSNIIVTAEYVSYLANYCDQLYKQLLAKQDEEEEKNKQFKLEYKEYMFKKKYSQGFQIYISEKSYNNITCKDFASFQTAINDGNLKNVTKIDIKLDMDFERGKNNNYEEHENSFTIIFKPYEITFARKSNHNDPSMNQIENQINEIMKKFPVANTVFCDKGSK